MALSVRGVLDSGSPMTLFMLIAFALIPVVVSYWRLRERALQSAVVGWFAIVLCVVLAKFGS